MDDLYRKPFNTCAIRLKIVNEKCVSLSHNSARTQRLPRRIKQYSWIQDSGRIECRLRTLKSLPRKWIRLRFIPRSMIAAHGVVMGHCSAQRRDRFISRFFELFPFRQYAGQISASNTAV